MLLLRLEIIELGDPAADKGDDYKEIYDLDPEVEVLKAEYSPLRETLVMVNSSTARARQSGDSLGKSKKCCLCPYLLAIGQLSLTSACRFPHQKIRL